MFLPRVLRSWLSRSLAQPSPARYSSGRRSRSARRSLRTIQAPESLESRRFCAVDLMADMMSEPLNSLVDSENAAAEFSSDTVDTNSASTDQLPPALQLPDWSWQDLQFAEPVEDPLEGAEPTKDPLENAEPLQDPLDLAEPLNDPLNLAEPVVDPLENAEPVLDPLDYAEPVEDPLDQSEKSQDPLENSEPIDP